MLGEAASFCHCYHTVHFFAVEQQSSLRWGGSVFRHGYLNNVWRLRHRGAVDMVGVTCSLKLSQSALADPQQYFHLSGVESGLRVYMSHIRETFGFEVLLWSDSTQSVNGPVARAFITESSCFWSKPPLHMQHDLSTQFCFHPLLREMWHDSHCRGLKPQFVTLFTQGRNMNFD